MGVVWQEESIDVVACCEGGLVGEDSARQEGEELDDAVRPDQRGQEAARVVVGALHVESHQRARTSSRLAG